MAGFLASSGERDQARSASAPYLAKSAVAGSGDGQPARSASAPYRAGEVPERVLILESFGRDVAPWNTITPVFKSELARQLGSPVEFHDAALETARENAPEAESAFAQYLRALYANRQPDLVVPVGGAAAQFWWRHRGALFPSTPVVVGGIENRVLRALTLSSNDTAVAVQFDLRAGPEVVLQVLPATTNIAVVVGDSKLERFWIAECRQAWAPWSNKVQLTWFNRLPFAEICSQASEMPPRSVVAYGMFFVDAAGVPHEQMRALDQICAAANAPVFGLFEEQLGHGIVGGRLLSSETIGRETARVAARVLRGERAGEIPTMVLSPSQPTFDWRQLQRWGIDERQLPQGSIVRFRQPSSWERYRWYIAGALGIMALQALTIVALLTQRTRRRRAEASLHESRQFMELATAAGELGLWVGDVPSRELWVNPPMRSLFGWADDQAVRWEDVLERVHPEDRDRAARSVGRIARDGGAFLFEGRLRLPDGSEKWITAKGLATHSPNGKPLRTQGIVVDITARHTAELAAQRHRNELLHIGRVHVLGQLSCALAHELNQPLGAILSNAEAAEMLLQSGAPDLRELCDILADIRKDDQRASDVIRRMRSLLSRHEMEFAPLSAEDLIAESIAIARPNAIERKVTVDCEVAPGTHRVSGDRVHLEQVLLNLLVNSMDAMRDCPPGHRRVRIRAKRAGDDTVEFAVEDTGAGIPPGDLERIFDLFHTKKASGLGVGLSISRTIIEAHHGRIWAENNADGGATLRFTLPVAGDRRPANGAFGESALPN